MNMRNVVIGVAMACVAVTTTPSWAQNLKDGSVKLAAAARCLGSKEISGGANPGGTWHGTKCDWKYGCSCTAVECTTKEGQTTYQNVQCSHIPG